MFMCLECSQLSILSSHTSKTLNGSINTSHDLAKFDWGLTGCPCDLLLLDHACTAPNWWDMNALLYFLPLLFVIFSWTDWISAGKLLAFHWKNNNKKNDVSALALWKPFYALSPVDILIAHALVCLNKRVIQSQLLDSVHKPQMLHK